MRPHPAAFLSLDPDTLFDDDFRLTHDQCHGALEYCANEPENGEGDLRRLPEVPRTTFKLLCEFPDRSVLPAPGTLLQVVNQKASEKFDQSRRQKSSLSNSRIGRGNDRRNSGTVGLQSKRQRMCRGKLNDAAICGYLFFFCCRSSARSLGSKDVPDSSPEHRGPGEASCCGQGLGDDGIDILLFVGGEDRDPGMLADRREGVA